jgi:hypothetical protein
MQSLTKPEASPPPSGRVVSKARALWKLYSPELPEFPLPEDAVAAVGEYPGKVPETLSQFARMLQAERDQQPKNGRTTYRLDQIDR